VSEGDASEASRCYSIGCLSHNHNHYQIERVNKGIMRLRHVYTVVTWYTGELKYEVSNLDSSSSLKSIAGDTKQRSGTNFNNWGPRNALKQSYGAPERSSGAFRPTLTLGTATYQVIHQLGLGLASSM